MTNTRLTPPKRPYKSIEDFRINCGHFMSSGSIEFLNHNPDKWPCLNCHARGSVDDESERGMPYGRANYIKCPVCKGTRSGTKEQCREEYNNRMSVYKKQYHKHMKRLTDRKSALKKLTKDEIASLIVLGF